MKTIATSTGERGAPVRIPYPSMAHLFEGTIDVHSALLGAHFVNPNCKLVVGVILHDGKDVFLVEPTNAPAGANRFIFPQEKAVYRKDSTYGAVALRGLQEEIGLSPRNVTLHPKCFSWFDNHIPLRRTGGVPTTKCIVYVVARIKEGARLSHNPKEVRRMAMVSSSDGYYDLARGIERARPHKWIGQTDALMTAVGNDLLSGPGWNEFKRPGAVSAVH